jgi:UDP-N-acetylglucosamine--N-acetylmuramyl-(pentapeptide) pyrophosphoryl-undecaprenol N-acetylglucosamine transferase
LENQLVPAAGWPLDLVDPVPLPRRLTPKLISLPARLHRSIGQAKQVLISRKADLVIGFGGYVCVPVYLAARRLNIPVVVHEANAIAGLANRIGARQAAACCVTFANTGLPGEQVTGLPVNRQISGLDRFGARSAARASYGLADGAPVLLVSGGSQGARRLNQAVLAALPGLDQAGVQVLHITGQANFDQCQPDYQMTNGRYVKEAYVEAMATAYAAADLMLARSGSGTVTETAMVGLPAIFVPLPHGNGEQARNAAGLVAAGGGVMVMDDDLTADRLLKEVLPLIASPQRLTDMAAVGQAMMPRDAADRLARIALSIVKNGPSL